MEDDGIKKFLRFLTYALSSNDETIDHLETLYETGSFVDKSQFQKLHNDLTVMGKKINLFIQTVMEKHTSEK
jgi:four helix bundle protein